MKKRKISYRNLIILLVAIVLLIGIGIAITMARYTSTGHSTVNAEVAFYVIKEGFQTGNIVFSNLYPREDPFMYTFTVANTDGTNKSEVSLDYNMELTITTNLPLDIKIYKRASGSNTYNELTDASDIENNVVLDESNQCYVRKIKIKNGEFTFNQSQEDAYSISAEFPIEYNEVEAYEGVLDNVSILLEAKQKIN